MKDTVISIIIIIAWIVATVLTIDYMRQLSSSEDVAVKTDTVTVIDTVMFAQPIPVHDTITRQIVRVLPILSRSDTAALPPQPSGNSDSVAVVLQVSQKTYSDSLYTAWISGYEPNLDSIDLRLPTITETVTNTIVKPLPLITFGIQAGAGIGIISRQPDVYISVGGQLNLWRK